MLQRCDKPGRMTIQLGSADFWGWELLSVALKPEALDEGMEGRAGGKALEPGMGWGDKLMKQSPLSHVRTYVHIQYSSSSWPGGPGSEWGGWEGRAVGHDHPLIVPQRLHSAELCVSSAAPGAVERRRQPRGGPRGGAQERRMGYHLR